MTWRKFLTLEGLLPVVVRCTEYVFPLIVLFAVTCLLIYFFKLTPKDELKASVAAFLHEDVWFI
jgi:hypothetical protein